MTAKDYVVLAALALTLLGIAGSVMVALLSLVRRKQARVSALPSPSAPGDRPLAILKTQKAMSDVLDGMPWSATYFSGSENSPPEVVLSVPASRSAQLLLAPESTTQRLAKGIGLSCEVQTGDEEFDRRFYLDTDDPDAIRRAFESAPHQPLTSWPRNTSCTSSPIRKSRARSGQAGPGRAAAPW